MFQLKNSFILVCFVSSALLCGAEFTNNFEAAKEQAAKENKNIIAIFVISDFIHPEAPCITLEEEVLSKDEFKKNVEKDFILFKADYPKKKKLPKWEKDQNHFLMRIYAVYEYPTMIIMNSKGTVIRRTSGIHPDKGISVESFTKWCRGEHRMKNPLYFFKKKR